MLHLAETAGDAPTGQAKRQARSAAAATTGGALLLSPTDKLMSPCSKILQKHPKRMWEQDQVENRGSEGAQDDGGDDEQGVCWREADLQLRVQPRPVPCSLPVILGSTSRYRRAVMKELGWQFSTASPNIDEKAIRDPDPRKMCCKIARAKAEALVGRLPDRNPSILITADQVCLFDGDEGEEVREKPESVEEAKGFLGSYSGRSVRTLSAICVTNIETGRREEGVHESEVVWRQIPSEVVDAVVERGIVMGSAGGFALEDPDLRVLVEKVEGSVDSVLGLPVDLLCDLISRAAAHGVRA